MKNYFALAPVLLLLPLFAAPAAAQQLVSFDPSQPAVAPPTATAWYYCANPSGYYPVVPQCSTPWQRIAVVTPMPLQDTASQVADLPASQLGAPLTAIPPPQPRQVAFYPSPDSLRQQDDRKLNSLAVEFVQIDPASPDAAGKLKALKGRVEAYRQMLLTRNYYVTDIEQDTQNLQRRMMEQEARFAVPAVPLVPVPEQNAAPAALTPEPAAIIPPQNNLLPSPAAPLQQASPPSIDEAPAPMAAPMPPVTSPTGPPLPLLPNSETTPL
jgi:hypothetical protein